MRQYRPVRVTARLVQGSYVSPAGPMRAAVRRIPVVRCGNGLDGIGISDHADEHSEDVPSIRSWRTEGKGTRQ